jgi:hypothetical protein
VQLAITFDRASIRTLALETSLPTDSPHLAFLLWAAAALVLPRPDRRLRAALGLPACLLGAASLRLAGGYPAPRVFLAISAALLLIGVVPVASNRRCLREVRATPPGGDLGRPAPLAFLIARPVGGGPVRRCWWRRADRPRRCSGQRRVGAAGDAVRWLDARLRRRTSW